MGIPLAGVRESVSSTIMRTMVLVYTLDGGITVCTMCNEFRIKRLPRLFARACGELTW